nr:formin-like protein 5 isoform X2 [Lolium perenne]
MPPPPPPPLTDPLAAPPPRRPPAPPPGVRRGEPHSAGRRIETTADSPPPLQLRQEVHGPRPPQRRALPPRASTSRRTPSRLRQAARGALAADAVAQREGEVGGDRPRQREGELWLFSLPRAPFAMCILSRAAGLANTSSLLSPTRPSPTNRCTSPAALLVPRRPDEVRRLVRLTFVRPPLIMPSCFLWDYIKVDFICKTNTTTD